MAYIGMSPWISCEFLMVSKRMFWVRLNRKHVSSPPYLMVKSIPLMF